MNQVKILYKTKFYKSILKCKCCLPKQVLFGCGEYIRGTVTLQWSRKCAGDNTPSSIFVLHSSTTASARAGNVNLPTISLSLIVVITYAKYRSQLHCKLQVRLIIYSYFLNECSYLFCFEHNFPKLKFFNTKYSFSIYLQQSRT